MSIRKTPFVPGEFYHIYNRGNSKQVIFNDGADYHRFISLLYLANSKGKLVFGRSKIDAINIKNEEKLVNIGSYCLMPNHFHIIVSQPENGDISRFMQKITTAYSMYFNKRYDRSGVLFEGKFKSKYIDNDRYFKYLFSYIHLNPVKIIQKDWKENGINDKIGAWEFLKSYKYSSFLDYLGINRPENKILNREFFPDYFPDKDNFEKDIMEWLSYGEDTENEEDEGISHVKALP